MSHLKIVKARKPRGRYIRPPSAIQKAVRKELAKRGPSIALADARLDELRKEALRCAIDHHSREPINSEVTKETARVFFGFLTGGQ